MVTGNIEKPKAYELKNKTPDNPSQFINDHKKIPGIDPDELYSIGNIVSITGIRSEEIHAAIESGSLHITSTYKDRYARNLRIPGYSVIEYLNHDEVTSAPELLENVIHDEVNGQTFTIEKDLTNKFDSGTMNSRKYDKLVASPPVIEGYTIPSWFPDGLTGKEDPGEVVTATYHHFSKEIRKFLSSLSQDKNIIDDLESDIYIKLLEKYSSFKPKIGPYKPWLFSVAHHHFIDYIRIIKRRNEIIDANPLKDKWGNPLSEGENSIHKDIEIDQMFTEGDNTFIEANRSIDGQLIQHALEKIPPEQKVVLLLVSEGYTQREISEITDAPLGTVKGRDRLGKKHLAEQLEEIRLEYSYFFGYEF